MPKIAFLYCFWGALSKKGPYLKIVQKARFLYKIYIAVLGKFKTYANATSFTVLERNLILTKFPSVFANMFLVSVLPINISFVAAKLDLSSPVCYEAGLIPFLGKFNLISFLQNYTCADSTKLDLIQFSRRIDTSTSDSLFLNLGPTLLCETKAHVLQIP